MRFRPKPGSHVRIYGGDHSGEIAVVREVKPENASWAAVRYFPSGGGDVHAASADNLTPVECCPECGGEGFVDVD